MASPGSPEIKFWTGREICEADHGNEVDWLVVGYLASGAVTVLDGKPKIGKTTLALEAIKAMVSGGRFLSKAVAQTRVVLLSEQNRSTLRPALERAGLSESDDFEVLFWHEVAAKEWPDVCALAAAECERCDAGLLVIDTLSQFARLKDENSAAEVLAAVQPLQQAAAGGLAVLLNRHDRKAGGEVGDSGRGSNSLSGAVDIIVAMSRAEGGQARAELRALKALSRFGETPRNLLIELTAEGYVEHGDATAYSIEAARQALRELLPAGEAEAQTEEALLKLLKEQGVARSTLKRALADPGVLRLGSGRKGSPFRYYRTAAEV